ncbi:hypothetical protein Glove_326g33 [Diversispora epigaea]|uniref:Protein kinase domain-containing protein n=1 Tax=Diversispora epigaea TaxID=1348612 RepID=A0A397HLR7_9GLOM|nr:hypothetical protein Glove_326g33 [Diversispora epigaea]
MSVRSDVLCRVDSGAFCESCQRCGQRLPRSQWCQHCEKKQFQSSFNTWSSGSDKLDKLIKSSQNKSNSSIDYIEWIPFNKLNDIKFVSSGQYGSVSSAIWMDGPRWNWNEETNSWERAGPTVVALKTISNSKHLSATFFHELKGFYNNSIESNRIVHCYGISRDPNTKNYMVVMEHANQGSLYQYLAKNFTTLTWNKKLNIISDIVQGLKNIHEANLTHRNLHCGNILIHGGGGNSSKEDYVAIGDIGLNRHAEKSLKIFNNNNVLYGVMPYIAPEVLQGRPLNKSSDIYSTGMLMWVITSGKQPFEERNQNFQLQIDICNGARPDITPDTPQVYQDLMESCWNQDPKKRPSIQTIHLNLRDILKNTSLTNIKEQLEEAERIRLELVKEHVTLPQSVHFTSREIKIIHVSPTKLNLEIYNIKPKSYKKIKFGLKKPEQSLGMSKEKIHIQGDPTDNKDSLITLPETFNNTVLNLELTDFTKKFKKNKNKNKNKNLVKPEKDSSIPDQRSCCKCSIM